MNLTGSGGDRELHAITVRFPVGLYAQLEAYATAQDQAMAQVVRKAVRMFLTDEHASERHATP